MRDSRFVDGLRAFAVETLDKGTAPAEVFDEASVRKAGAHRGGARRAQDLGKTRVM
jgi:hypothetical protein